MIMALQIPWVSLEAIRAVESSLGSCGIANLTILQLGKIVGDGGSDYPWGGLGCRVKAGWRNRDWLGFEKGGKKGVIKGLGVTGKELPLGVTREKTDEEFTEAENNKEHADIQATNILSQGLPRHIFNTLNQTETTKEIWENVELLMQGSTTIQDGQITTESVQRRALGNKGKHVATGFQGKVWFKDKALLMEAKEKGVILDAEAKAFMADVECTTPYAKPLAITTTTAFEVSHEDAYDSDVDDLHKSALGHRNPLVYDSEETLVQAEVSRTKMLERMKDPLCKVSSKPINYAKLNSLYDTFVPQKQLSREHVYWLPANEVASYNCNQSKPVTNFVRTRPAKSQVNTQLKMLKACFPEFDKKSLEIENKNLLIQNECLLAESVSKDICSVVLTSDIVVPMSVEPRSNCVEEHSRNLELEAEILIM
ncbi:hypothetical protein Tco_0379366 [Tanacetum coccineum]